jgi:hypothetical protein
VEKTGAKLVIPVHWDDYTRPLKPPLKWFGWPDDPPADMRIVRELADKSGVRVAFMPLFEPVDIMAEAQIDPAARHVLPPPTVVRQPPSCPF